MKNNITIAKQFEAVKNHVESLDNNEQVNFHNIYCQGNNYSDNEIYTNDEDFFNTFFEGKVIEAVRAVSFGEYNFSHDYVIFNGYGNLESFDNPEAHIDIDEIVSDILESPENYDIELEECFEIDGTFYEGTEDEAKDQYEEYKEAIEAENS